MNMQHKQSKNPFFTPQCELTVGEDSLNVYVEAPLPGLTRENIEITLEKEILSINGKPKQHKEENITYYCKANRAYSYQMRLPKSVNAHSESKAIYENGLLKIIFRKRPEELLKRINIIE